MGTLRESQIARPGITARIMIMPLGMLLAASVPRHVLSVASLRVHFNLLKEVDIRMLTS